MVRFNQGCVARLLGYSDDLKIAGESEVFLSPKIMSENKVNLKKKICHTHVDWSSLELKDTAAPGLFQSPFGIRVQN